MHALHITCRLDNHIQMKCALSDL